MGKLTRKSLRKSLRTTRLPRRFRDDDPVTPTSPVRNPIIPVGFELFFSPLPAQVMTTPRTQREQDSGGYDKVAHDKLVRDLAAEFGLK